MAAAANPFDQFDAPSGGGNPFDQFDKGAKPGAKSSQPSDMDYSNSPWSALGRTFESSATLGVGDLIRAAATGKKPSETAAQSSAAAASLPWYIRYPTEALGYGLGAANLLNPVSDVAEAGALGLGAGAGLARIAGTAAEGAAAGGISHVAGSDQPGLIDTAGSALGGAAVGGAAGAAAPLINKGLTKALGKAGTVDPAAAVTSTENIKKAAYGAIDGPGAPQFPAQSFIDAYTSPISTLSKPQKLDVSPGFMKIMQDHANAVQADGYVSTGDAASYVRDLQGAANSNAEKILAARIRDNVVGDNGMLKTEATVSGHPTGQAYDMLQDANKANAQYENALALQQLQQQLKEFGEGPGSVPQTQAEKYYKVGDPEREIWSSLAQANKPGIDPRYVFAHTGGEIGGDIGALLFGFPGLVAGKIGGYLGGKELGKKMGTGWGNRAALRSYQAAYPGLTEIQPTGGRVAPQISGGVGDWLKNLTMGLGGY